ETNPFGPRLVAAWPARQRGRPACWFAFRWADGRPRSEFVDLARSPVGRSGPGRLVYCGKPKHFPRAVPRMSEVTRILSAIEQGDPSAAEPLLPLVYAELRKLAAQKLAKETPDQTLEATALVHEAYLRLV